MSQIRQRTLRLLFALHRTQQMIAWLLQNQMKLLQRLGARFEIVESYSCAAESLY